MGTSLPPAEGVREIELMVTTKDRMEVPGGGVKGTAARVTLRVASPFWPQLVVQTFFVPLHEVRKNIAARATKTALRFEFMHVPLIDMGLALATGGWNPPQHFNPA